MRERPAALALALALVIAGCTVPFGVHSGGETPTATPHAEPTLTTTPTPERTPTTPTSGTPTASPTATPERGVTVEGGNLSVDPDLVYGRVTTLTGREVAPPTVTVRALGLDSSILGATPIHRMLGLSEARLTANRSFGLTTIDGEVYLDPDGNRTSDERTLAHEYVHVVQFESGMIERPRRYDARLSSDFSLAWRMVVEGGAVYVTDAYVRRHMPNATPQSTVFARAYADPATPGSRLALAPYHFGYRYVADRVDSPADLAAAAEPFPNTTEQVLHGREPAAEPPRPLSVDVERGDRWRTRGRTDRTGELFVRVVLRTELDRERAAEAAAGWGNDRWQVLRTVDQTAWGLAWVLRWDSPGDADEFERAARDYVERRRANASGSFRVERLEEDTVALFVGDDEFVDNATATASDGDVAVTVGEPEEDD